MPQTIDRGANDCLILSRHGTAFGERGYQVYVITRQTAADVMDADRFVIGCLHQAIDHAVLNPMGKRHEAAWLDESLFRFSTHLLLHGSGHCY